MITNLQALAREVEVHLNSNTQITNILRRRIEAGAPSTQHKNYIHNSLLDLAQHGIYLRNTQQPIINAVLNVLLCADDSTPKPAALGHPEYTPASQILSVPAKKDIDIDHLKYAYKGEYYNHILDNLSAPTSSHLHPL